MMSLNFDLVARLPGWRLLTQSCLVLLGLGITNFITKLYRIRRKFQRMQNDGLVSFCRDLALTIQYLCSFALHDLMADEAT